MNSNPTELPVTDPVKFLHVSAISYHLPGPGKDLHVDHLVARGELLLRGETVKRDGTVVRFAVSKGKTYRRYPDDSRDRREHRDEQFGRNQFTQPSQGT